MASERIVYFQATGQTTRVEIIRRSDKLRRDWADGVFKTVGSLTTRFQNMTADASSATYYEVSIDPATWQDGIYDFLLTTSTGVHVAGFAFSADRGVLAKVVGDAARAVWTYDLDLADEDSLGTRAATRLTNIWRRWFGRFSFNRSTGQTKIRNRNNTADLATIPSTDDGTTQSFGPAS